LGSGGARWFSFLRCSWAALVLLDGRYESTIRSSLGYVVFYPLVYWVFMSVATVVNTPRALIRPRPETARWHTVRGT